MRRALSHLNRQVRTHLQITILGYWICRSGPFASLPKSADLSLIDFFCKFFKTNCIVNTSVTTGRLRKNCSSSTIYPRNIWYFSEDVILNYSFNVILKYYIKRPLAALDNICDPIFNRNFLSLLYAENASGFF